MNSYKHANEINYNLIADNLNVLIAKLHHHLQMCALTFLHHFLIPCFVTAGMNGTDLGDHSCCFEVASTASLAALMETEASVWDNGPFDLAMFCA